MPRLLALACALRLGFASAWADETALVQREVLAHDVKEEDVLHSYDEEDADLEEEDAFDLEEEDAPQGKFRMGERVQVEGVDPLKYVVISGQGASPAYYHLNAQGDTYLNVHKSKLQRWKTPTPLPPVFPTAQLDEPKPRKVMAAPKKPLDAKRTALKKPLAAKLQPRAAPKKPLAKSQPRAAPKQPPAAKPQPAAAPKKPVPDTAAEAERSLASIQEALLRKRAERTKVLKDQAALDNELKEKREKLESEVTESQKLAQDLQKHRAEEAEKKKKAAKEAASKMVKKGMAVAHAAKALSYFQR